MDRPLHTEAMPLCAEVPPREVDDAASKAREFMARALAVVVDDSEESLAIADHYLTSVPGERVEIVRLLATAIGCYFGEVVRRRFGGCWVLEGEDPACWRLQLGPCFLYFYPIGVAAEAICRGAAEGYEASIATLDVLEPLLEHSLAAAGPVSEEYYYSLTGRLETLERVVDLLLASGGGDPRLLAPTAEHYAAVIAGRAAAAAATRRS